MSEHQCNKTKKATKEAAIELKLDGMKKGEHLSNIENDKVLGKGIMTILNKLTSKRKLERKKYNFISNEELQPIIDKTLGKDADKGAWLLHIGTALERRPDLKDLFDELSWNLVLQHTLSKDEDAQKYISRVKEDGGIVPDIKNLPTGLLSQIGGMLAAMMSTSKDGDLNISTGYLGNLQLEFITPMRLAQMTANAPFYKFIKQLTFYNQKVEQETRKFTRNRPERKIDLTSAREKKFPGGSSIFNRKDYGLVELMNTAAGMLMQEPLADKFADREDLIELVSMLLRGQAYIEEDGNVWVYKREQKVQGKYYPGTRDPIYSFFERVPYMMSEEGNFIGVENDPVLGDAQLKFDNKKRYPLWKTQNKKTGLNQMEIFLNYITSIQDILDESGRSFVAEYNEIADERDKLRAEIKHLPKEEQKEIARYLTMLDNEFLQIHGLTQFQMIDTKKKSFFPRLYTAGKRIKAIRAAQIEWSKRVDDASVLYESEAEPGKKMERFFDLVESNRNLILLDQKLEILANPDVLRDTSQSDNPIFIDNYAKHFREISHLIPINVARTDEFVIQDYISENVKTIERMKVVLELTRLAKQNYAKPRSMKYAINLFKRTFGFPDAEGSILGFRFQDDSMAKVLNMVGLNIDPDAPNRSFRTLNSVNVGNLLSGPLDGVQNYSSVLQDILTSGREEFNIASQMLRKNRAYWMEKAENAGITVYIKYLEGFVDKVFRAGELADYKDAKKHILKSIKKIDNMPRKTSRRELRRQFNNDLKVLKRQYPGVVSRTARKIGNYAIQRRVELEKVESRTKGAVKLILNAYGIMPSIEQTETDLRVISYIIAYNKIKKLLRGHSLPAAKIDTLARNYVFFTQFGLEAQHVGDLYGTTLGKWWGSLGVWRNQKFGWSLDVQRQLIRSYFKPQELFEHDEEGNPLKEKDKSKFTKKWMKTKATANAYADAMISMLHLPWHGATYSKRAEAYRRLAPAIRKGQGHLMIHGLATAAFTSIIFTNPAWLSWAPLLYARRIIQNKGMHKMGYGLNDPLYALIFASGALISNVAMGDEEDQEEKNLFLGSKVGRSLYGVGGTDTILTLLALNKYYEAYLSGEPADDSYYQNPAAQHSFSSGLYGEIMNGAKVAVDYTGELFEDWNYDRKLQKSAGKVNRYYKYSKMNR